MVSMNGVHTKRIRSDITSPERTVVLQDLYLPIAIQCSRYSYRRLQFDSKLIVDVLINKVGKAIRDKFHYLEEEGKPQ